MPVRNPVSKEVDNPPEDVTSGGPIYMHMHSCTHMHTHACLHTRAHICTHNLFLKNIKKAISNKLSEELIASFEICTALSAMVRIHYENPLIPRIQRTEIKSTTHTQAFSECISAPAVPCTHHRVSHHTGLSQPTVSRSVFVPELMCPHNFTQVQKAVWADRGNTVWPLNAAFNLAGTHCSLL